MQAKTEDHNKKTSMLFGVFSPSAKEELKVCFGLILLILVFRFKAFSHFNEYFLGSIQGDAGLYVWLLKTNINDLFFLDWFEKNAFFPYANVLAWSDNFILPSMLAWPFFKLGFSDQSVFNSLILAATFLNGYFAYLLCYKLSGESQASFFAGAVFMTLPFFTHHLGHPQLQFFFFIPLGVIYLINFFNRPGMLNSIKISAVVVASFLTTVYYSIFFVVTCGTTLLAIFLLRPKAISGKTVLYLITSASLALITLAPFLIPYLSVKATFGERGLYEAYYFSAKFFSYLSSVPYNFIYNSTKSLSHSEAHLFPGIGLSLLTLLAIGRIAEARKAGFYLYTVLFLLTVCALVSLFSPDNSLRVLTALLLWSILIASFCTLRSLGWSERKLGFNVITGRDISAVFFLLAVVFFIISLGPGGNPERGQYTFNPYIFFYNFVPGFSSIRAISRSGIVVLFALCILAALYFSRLYIKKALRGAALTAFFFVLTENYTYDYPLSKLPPAPDNFLHADSDNSPHAAAVLPFAGRLDKNKQVLSWGEFAKINLTYLLWNNQTNRPLFNGYSGQKNKYMRDYPRKLEGFPDLRSVDSLARIAGLKQIIFVPAFVRDFNQNDFEIKFQQLPQLKLLSKDSQGTYLFELNHEISNNYEKPVLLHSGSNSILELELRTAYKQKHDYLEIQAFLKKPNSDMHIGNIQIKADGSWNKSSLNIPANKSNVSPQLLYFKADNSEIGDIFIKNLYVKDLP